MWNNVANQTTALTVAFDIAKIQPIFITATGESKKCNTSFTDLQRHWLLDVQLFTEFTRKYPTEHLSSTDQNKEKKNINIYIFWTRPATQYSIIICSWWTSAEAAGARCITFAGSLKQPSSPSLFFKLALLCGDAVLLLADWRGLQISSKKTEKQAQLYRKDKNKKQRWQHLVVSLWKETILVRLSRPRGAWINAFNALITSICLAANLLHLWRDPTLLAKSGQQQQWRRRTAFAYSITHAHKHTRTHNLVTAPCEAGSILTCMLALELYMTGCIIAATPAGLTRPDEGLFLSPSLLLFFLGRLIFLSLQENITGVMSVWECDENNTGKLLQHCFKTTCTCLPQSAHQGRGGGRSEWGGGGDVEHVWLDVSTRRRQWRWLTSCARGAESGKTLRFHHTGKWCKT